MLWDTKQEEIGAFGESGINIYWVPTMYLIYIFSFNPHKNSLKD